MKTLEQLYQEIESKESKKELARIIANESVDVDTLTEKDKVSVLIFRELQKAMPDGVELVLDCNYPKSKNESPVLTYYRVVPTGAVKTLIQVKLTSVSRAGANFKLHTSSVERVRNELLSRGLGYEFIKSGGKVKVSTRKKTSYEEIASIIASTFLVLTLTTLSDSKEDIKEVKKEVQEVVKEVKEVQAKKKPAAKKTKAKKENPESTVPSA